MNTRFRTGQLLACPQFPSTVPRSAMIQAFVRHVTDERPLIEGEPIRSEFRHAEITFHPETSADHQSTAVCLN